MLRPYFSSAVTLSDPQVPPEALCTSAISPASQILFGHGSQPISGLLFLTSGSSPGVCRRMGDRVGMQPQGAAATVSAAHASAGALLQSPPLALLDAHSQRLDEVERDSPQTTTTQRGHLRPTHIGAESVAGGRARRPTGWNAARRERRARARPSPA
jgi:hypothetical protein